MIKKIKNNKQSIINDMSFHLYLYTNGKIVLFDSLVIQRMIYFDIGIRPSINFLLLKIKRVILVGLIS